MVGERGPLEVADAACGDQAEEEREKDGSDDGDEDGVEKAAGAGVAEVDHDNASDDGAKDADDDIDDGAEAGAAHDAAGDVAGDEADEYPDEDAVGAFGGLDVAIDVDVVVDRGHVRLLKFCGTVSQRGCGQGWLFDGGKFGLGMGWFPLMGAL